MSSDSLDRARVAELLVTHAGGRRRGSGYRVTADAVLTAAHVLEGAVSVQARFEPDLPGEWTADTVSWTVDAASGIAVVTESGVVREMPDGSLEFIHRTFQDHLAAKEVVEEDNLPLLLDNADKPHWHDVVVMAGAHARPSERIWLLRQLLERARTESGHRDALNLLAAAILEQTDVLPQQSGSSPDVREQVNQAMATLIPPPPTGPPPTNSPRPVRSSSACCPTRATSTTNRPCSWCARWPGSPLAGRTRPAPSRRSSSTSTRASAPRAA